MHVDVAARNCLLHTRNIVKIADFGLTKKMDEGKSSYLLRTTMKLSMKWLAPEVLENKSLSGKFGSVGNPQPYIIRNVGYLGLWCDLVGDFFLRRHAFRRGVWLALCTANCPPDPQCRNPSPFARGLASTAPRGRARVCLGYS